MVADTPVLITGVGVPTEEGARLSFMSVPCATLCLWCSGWVGQRGRQRCSEAPLSILRLAWLVAIVVLLIPMLLTLIVYLQYPLNSLASHKTLWGSQSHPQNTGSLVTEFTFFKVMKLMCLYGLCPVRCTNPKWIAL